MPRRSKYTHPILLLLIGLLMLVGGILIIANPRPMDVAGAGTGGRYPGPTSVMVDKEGSSVLGYIFAGCGVFILCGYLKICLEIRKERKQNE